MPLPADSLDEAEQTVLACMMRSDRAADEVALVVGPEQFRSGWHASIYRAAAALRAAGLPAEPVAVYERLRLEGAADANTVPALVRMFEDLPSVANAAYYAGIVRERWTLRQLASAGRALAAEADAPSRPAAEVLEAAEASLFALGEASARPVGTLADSVDEALDALDRRIRDGVQGVLSGLDELDLLTTGFQRGEMAVFAARPSVGKTALAAALALHAARSGHGVLFCSLEQPRCQIADRILLATADANPHDYRAGKTRGHDVGRLSDAAASLRGLPVWIDDAPAQTVARVASQARRLVRSSGVRLVVVDYLQLVRPEDARPPRHEQVALVSRRLKALAREAGVAVLALAQLNREVEGRPDGAPRLSDLRDSGSIEADADLVVLLHKPADLPGALALTVAKQRNGPTGQVVVWFDRATMRFRSRDGDGDSDPFARRAA